MTASREDYLKEIYKLGGAEKNISNKQISDKLNIAPASVSEMLSKLKDEGFIKYERYKGIHLTEKGRKKSITLLRSHRLWEVFLIKHLEYRWSDAHEDAELLEHVTPMQMAEKLNKFLNYPTHCPHGSEIPDENGNIVVIPQIALTQLEVGNASYICRIIEKRELMDYLQDMGFKMGLKVKVLEKGAYEGALTIELNGEKLQISYKAAQEVFVRDI